jgi:hypothetical protein
MAEVMNNCPSCGTELDGRILTVRGQGTVRELRRCPTCRRLAAREAGTSQLWADSEPDPSVDYLFDWEPRQLPEPWQLLPDAQSGTILTAQLHAEVGEGHPLFGKTVTAVARCSRCDEVLFCVEDEPARFVQVHLTWRRGPELPPWPKTKERTMPLADSLTDHH